MSIGVMSLFVIVSIATSAAQSQLQTLGELVRNGNLDQARAEISNALNAAPRDAELWNLLGIVNARENKSAAAEEAFRKAVTLAPRLEPAWLNLGRLYLQNASNEAVAEKAREAYRTVIRLNPLNAEARHQLALLLEWKGAFRESLAQLRLLPAEDQRRRSALAIQCADEAALGNTQSALTIAAQLLQNPELEEADIVAILPAIERTNEAVTLRLLQGLQARGLSTPATQARLAAIYERKGNLRDARELYEKVAQGSPGMAAPLLDLARVAWKQKEYEATLGYLAHARDIEPGNAGIHFFFGVTSNELKLPVEARKSLQQALKLEPENPYYNYAMGAVELQWLNKAQSLPYLVKFVELRPNDARGHLALATAYFGMDKDAEAKAQLALALKAPQTSPGAEYLLGLIAARQDDTAEAIAHFRRLLALEPKSPEGHSELSAVLLEQQDLEGCRREIERTLSVEPENYTANRTLLKLYRTTGDPRTNQQIERMKQLIENKEAGLRLLQRTIEVKPW